MRKAYDITKLSIFWVWNIVFLVLILFGVLPYMGAILATAIPAGELPVSFLVSFLMLLITPIVCIALAIRKFRNRPQDLLRLFYGVEVPLLLVAFLRLFLLRELTFASAFILGGLIVGALIYCIHLLRGAAQDKRTHFLSYPFNTLLLITAIYSGLILLMLLAPAIFDVLVYTVSFAWFWPFINELAHFPRMIENFFRIGWIFPLALFLSFMSATLFLFFPFAIIIYYVQAWHHEMKKLHLSFVLPSTVIVVFIWGGLFYSAQYQPQRDIFVLLSKPAQTLEEKKKRFALREDIKAGLVNAYLYPYRYLSPAKPINNISKSYRDSFGLSEQTAEMFQSWFNVLISPALYQGDGNDMEKAAELYASMFDVSIQKAEQRAIIDALSSTAQGRRSVETGILDINEKKVWLKHQSLTTQQNGSVTNVSLYEVYENQTYRMQEIYYNFSLPENAVITGIWLGENERKEEGFKYQVAPRGAAQKVYRAQVRRRVDPALLEQVGPSQYRLRIFPIPVRMLRPRNRRAQNIDNGDLSQKRMHMWLTYSVLTEAGSSVSPILLEKRNVFWNEDTERVFNGRTVKPQEQWTPIFAPSDKSDSANYKVLVSTGADTYEIHSRPAPQAQMKEKRKFAVVLDSSYSMNEKRSSIDAAIKWALSQKHDIHLFVQSVNEALKKVDAKSYASSSTAFIGTVTNGELWNQAVEVQSLDTYDAVFILTDQGSSDLADNTPELKDSVAPVIFVHLDLLAPIYIDSVLKKVMQNRNGATTSLEDAYHLYASRQNNKGDVLIAGNRLWSFNKKSGTTEANETQEVKSQPVTQVASKHLIDYLASSMEVTDVEQLDKVHAIAKSYSVLTPYSSMIVLVNKAQKEQLKKAEQDKDRFNRTHETGKQTLTKPGNPLVVSGVPEPEEWILLIIALISLSYFYRRRRFGFA